MASAAPMPRAAPVTTAVRPSSLKVHLSRLLTLPSTPKEGVVFVTCQLIVYETNLCVQNRYIHLCMHYLLALCWDRIRLGVGCLSAGSHSRLSHSRLWEEAPPAGGALSRY